MIFAKHSLVLYKQGPALVLELGAKISIQLESGKTVKVREKDIQLLHVGPLKTLGQLQPEPEGSVEDAWELLQGEAAALSDLADLIYGETTPKAVWHAWCVLNEDTYFSGSIDEVVARTDSDVKAIFAKRNEKERACGLWQGIYQPHLKSP